MKRERVGGKITVSLSNYIFIGKLPIEVNMNEVPDDVMLRSESTTELPPPIPPRMI